MIQILEEHDLRTVPPPPVMEGSIGRGLGLDAIDLRIGLDLARARLLRGRLEDAFRVYVALVLCDPNEPDLQLGLANCAIQLGEYAVALQAASAIIAGSRRDPRGYYLSARASAGLGQISDAREDLLAAIEFGKSTGDAITVAAAEQLFASLSTAGQ